MDNLDKLAELMLSIKSKEEMHDLLKSILTPAELVEIPKRLQIFVMLNSGVPQRQIAEKLDVSLGTISRGSRELKYGNSNIRKLIS